MPDNNTGEKTFPGRCPDGLECLGEIHLGQLGCMDLCVYDPATGATTVKHSATEIVSAQCSAAYRVK